jgi:hypothetical protein
MTKTQAIEIAGTLSEPSKMPAYSYGLPAQECITGSKLVSVPGSVCHDCYALKGNYKRWARTIMPAQYKRLDSITDPNWVEAMVTLIGKNPKTPYFRWHDSGDIQSVDHLKKIANVAWQLPDVHFWLPTREYAIVREFMAKNLVPDNLTIRLSAHMVDGPVPSINDLPTSSVFTDNVPSGAWECPSRYQDNACGDCRACWDPKVQQVSYHKH